MVLQITHTLILLLQDSRMMDKMVIAIIPIYK